MTVHRPPLIAFLTRRFKRRALTRPNLTFWLWRLLANGKGTYRALTTRALFPECQALVQTLREEGIVVGPCRMFLAKDGLRALAEAAPTILAASQSDAVRAVVAGHASSGQRKKDFLVHLASYPKGIPADDCLLRVALDPKLLEIVASYLGMWPRLHSVAAWLNHPTDAPASTSQLWHSDPEDLKVIKVFIYLAPVDETCGPFTYVPGTQPFGREAAKAATCGKRATDDEMASVFPPASWRVCTGPANTVILADTTGYHRGGKPTAGQRILVTFTYTSATPLVPRRIRLAGTAQWMDTNIQHSALGTSRA